MHAYRINPFHQNCTKQMMRRATAKKACYVSWLSVVAVRMAVRTYKQTLCACIIVCLHEPRSKKCKKGHTCSRMKVGEFFPRHPTYASGISVMIKQAGFFPVFIIRCHSLIQLVICHSMPKKTDKKCKTKGIYNLCAGRHSTHAGHIARRVITCSTS